MLTLQYMQQKLGLDAHILQTTQTSIANIHEFVYARLAYCHSSSNYKNTLHRVNILSHITSPPQEQLAANPHFCTKHQFIHKNGQTLHILQSKQQHFSILEGWVMCCACMTMGGMTLWVSVHCHVAANTCCLNVPNPPEIFDQPFHAFSV